MYRSHSCKRVHDYALNLLLFEDGCHPQKEEQIIYLFHFVDSYKQV